MKEIPSELPQLTTLHAEIGFALIHGGTLRSMLQRCTEVLVQSLDAAFVRIWTFNEKKGALELQSSAGMYTHIDGDHSIIPVGMYKIGLIAKERKPHLTNAVIGDPGVHNQEWAKREEIVSFAGYPMIVEDRLIGVLALFSKKQLSDDILKILASVSDNVAIGIDRKQMEESLRKSEERLTEVQRIAHIGNWERNIITNEIYWSDEMYRIFGLNPQEYSEITYERFLNCVHPDDREFVKKSIHDALYGKKSYEVDYRVIHEDGTVRIVHSRALVKFDHTGKPVRMIGTVQDITYRKLVEEELRLEKNKLQSVIDAMEDGLTIQDLDYNIVYQNNVVKNIFGVRLGYKCYSSYESKDTICDGCPVEMVYKDGKPHISERKVVIPSGEIVYVENIASPIKDSSGKIVYCLEICRNVTERKNHESQILYMANRDPLTDLFNRRRFHEELEHWLAETRRFGTKGALLFLDIDNFKDINVLWTSGRG